MNARFGAIRGRSGTNKYTVPCSAHAKTEETIVKTLTNDFGNLYLFGLGMLRIEQVVPCTGDYGGWNTRQSRFKRCKPGIADGTSKLGMLPPIRRGNCIQFLRYKLIWNQDLKQLIRTRKFPILFQVDVHHVDDPLEHCAGRTLRQIND